MSEQAERRVGSVIGGKWRVDSLLGSGSMAAVFAVTHRNGARAALKILHPTLCADPAVCERFLGEGYLTNSVKHAGIVRVLDDGVTDDGCVFLVMDLLEGRTLETLRQDRGGQIPLKEILAISDKLMDALQAVHSGGIIHRDLKPQNVFVCEDGSVKLLDFGVARVFDKAAQSKLSAFGLVLGTPSFMSPEQALGSRDKVDHRSDIWSLGATIFTAITGQTVHLGPHVQAKLLAAATAKARSIALVKQDLPLSVASAIDIALRFKKEDRWQSVDAFRRAFRDASAQLGLPKPESVPPPPGFDLSDAPTHADTGERALAIMGHVDHSPSPPKQQEQQLQQQKPAPPRPQKSAPPPVPTATRQGPPAPVRHGPAGTFIGVGSALETPVGSQVESMQQTQRLPSRAPERHQQQPQQQPQPQQQQQQPQPNTSRPPLPSRPSSRPDFAAQEGSYPAVGSTGSALAQLEERRGAGVGVWIAAVALVIAAASGIAFFAVNRSNAAQNGPDRSVTSSRVPLTSATASSAPLDLNAPGAPKKDASSSSSLGDTPSKSAVDDSSTARAAQPTTPTTTPTTTAATPPPPVVGRILPAPRPASRSTPTNNANTASTTNTAAPAPTPIPTVPPDPFGTPD